MARTASIGLSGDEEINMLRVFMVGMSTNKGGVEAYVVNLCGHLPEEYEITYCLPHMEINGVAWDCPKNRHNYIRYWRFWKKFFRANRFDVLYYNTCDIVSIDMLRFAKAAGVPVRIIHSHSTDNQVKMTLFHKFTEKVNRRELHRYATHFFACSKNAGIWMFGDRKFSIIKNGISLKEYAFSATERGSCRAILGVGDEPIIGCVGRLDPQKNPLFSVEVARQVCLLNPKAHIVFIGDGELREQVNNLIEQYHLADHIHLLGARDDVNRWYSAFDCLMMPSLFEGLPFVLVEAQAAGLPCVVSTEVSQDANITGLVEYVSLKESAQNWAKNLLQAAKKPRQDTLQRLLEAGYSIEETSKEVSKIIGTALGETVC